MNRLLLLGSVLLLLLSACGGGGSSGDSNDTTAPTAPTVASLTTESTTPTISGTFDANDVAGGFTVQVNSVTYTLGTDAALTNSGNTWSLTIPAGNELVLGTYEVLVTATDGSGNAATDSTSNELVIVDITTPTAPTVTSLTTESITPTITGTFDANDVAGGFTVQVNSVTYTLGTDAALSSSGNSWSLTIPAGSELALGTYEVLATATDGSGNAAADSSSNELVIVDLTAPAVSATTPAHTDTEVALTSTISITFSEAMDTSTITAASFTLDNGVTGSLAFSSGDTVATFTPTASLRNGTTYTVSLGSSITDLAGNALTASSFSFTTSDWQGTKEWGAAGAIAPASAVATDNNGNVYATGNTTGSLDGNVLAGNGDMYLIKYNAIGNREWIRQLGGSGGLLNGVAIATDSSGNVFVTGSTDVGLNGNSLVGLQDAYLAKYDSAGLLQWTLQIGSAGKYTSGRAVAVDSSGYIYLAAGTDGSIDGHAMSGTGGTYLAKFDTNGIRQWSLIKSQSGCGVGPNAMSVDSSGNILISGMTNCNLDGQTLQGSSDLFVMKYDASQVWQWTRLTGVWTQKNGVVAADPNAIYLIGYTTGNVTIDGVTSSGNNDSLLVKFDGSGNGVWTKLTGTAGTGAYTYKGAVDASGNIYMTGETWGAQAGNTATGDADHLLIKYDASGNLLWVRQDGAVGGEAYGYGVAIDPDGNAFIAGEAMLAGLDGNTLIGNDDGFIAKYAPDGTKQ